MFAYTKAFIHSMHSRPQIKSKLNSCRVCLLDKSRLMRWHWFANCLTLLTWIGILYWHFVASRVQRKLPQSFAEHVRNLENEEHRVLNLWYNDAFKEYHTRHMNSDGPCPSCHKTALLTIITKVLINNACPTVCRNSSSSSPTNLFKFVSPV